VIRLNRGAAVLIVAPFLTFASAMAPQHIHEPDPSDNGHAVAHSHFGPHDAESHHAGTTPEIEHDIDHSERVVWVDGAILHQSIDQATQVPPALPVCRESTPQTHHWSVLRFDDAAPAHGPPRATHLFRGPPSPSQLI